jgi:hypothetical protein
MNNVLTMHEVLHETKRKGECRVVLKLDFENAYDKVNWSFLRQCLVLRGFSETWCGWVQKVVQDRTIAIKLNGMVGPYFQSFKGSGTETPFPLYCLILVQIVLREWWSGHNKTIL